MSKKTQGYFEQLAKTEYQPLLHLVTGTMRFDIEQSDGSRQIWRIAIDHGHVRVRRETETSEGVDCVLTGPEDEITRIVVGCDSFAAAHIRGAITVQGDYGLAQNVRRFSPPAKLMEGEPRHPKSEKPRRS